MPSVEAAPLVLSSGRLCTWVASGVATMPVQQAMRADAAPFVPQSEAAPEIFLGVGFGLELGSSVPWISAEVVEVDPVEASREDDCGYIWDWPTTFWPWVAVPLAFGGALCRYRLW